MMIVALLCGAVLITAVLWDVFEVIVLPRRVQRALRLARYFYRSLWRLWSGTTARLPSSASREALLSVFGPLSLIMLILTWAGALVFAYALLYWGSGGVGNAQGGESSFATDLYYSGTTFFTLGLGDIGPGDGAARTITVLEAGNGFVFLALVIGYLPIFYQSFSRRETNISLLDARAGSPPTAGELLRRYCTDDAAGSLSGLLADSERWAAELLEGMLSYPVLMFFRSQHERQSWVSALTVILDASAVIMTRGSGSDARAARLAFAMARHAAVDLSDVFERSPRAPERDRLQSADFARLDAIVSAKPAAEPRWRVGGRTEGAPGDVRAVRGGAVTVPEDAAPTVVAVNGSGGRQADEPRDTGERVNCASSGSPRVVRPAIPSSCHEQTPRGTIQAVRHDQRYCSRAILLMERRRNE